MTGELSVTEVVEAFESIESATACEPLTENSGRILVGLEDESDIGQFYQTVRELGVERSETTRNGTAAYEFDSWIDL